MPNKCRSESGAAGNRTRPIKWLDLGKRETSLRESTRNDAKRPAHTREVLMASTPKEHRVSGGTGCDGFTRCSTVLYALPPTLDAATTEAGRPVAALHETLTDFIGRRRARWCCGSSVRRTTRNSTRHEDRLRTACGSAWCPIRLHRASVVPRSGWPTGRDRDPRPCR